jgi:ligand-binding sensor domain-containing protein
MTAKKRHNPPVQSGPGMAGAAAWRAAGRNLTSAFVALLLLLSARASAQGPHDFQFGPELTTEHGLPQSTVTAFLPARSGYLWLGTFGGLVRFDGRTALVFSGTNTPGLTSNRILAIAEGRTDASDALDRDLWVGTEHGGLFRLTLAGDHATVAEHYLPQATVFALQRDARGTLWIGTEGGLARFTDGRLVTSADDPRLPPQAVLSLATDAGGRIWAGLEAGVTLIDAGSARPQPEFAGCSAAAAMPDAAGAGVWMATTCGLYRATGSGQAERVAAGSFVAVTRAGDGTIWAGQRTGTLMAFDGDGRLLRSIAGSGRLVRTLAVDGQGTIWFGTEGRGAGRLHRPFITSITLPSAEGGAVLPILEDPHGAIWVGARCLGLFRIDQGRAEKVSLGGSNRCVLTLALDRAGRLWAGGYDRAYRIDDLRAPANRTPVTELAVPTVYSIHESRAGELLFGTIEGLLEWRDGAVVPHTLRWPDATCGSWRTRRMAACGSGRPAASRAAREPCGPSGHRPTASPIPTSATSSRTAPARGSRPTAAASTSSRADG